MPAVAVIGGQWGDEGKGKVVDLLAARAKVVCRFSGGSNAGHTVINPMGRFQLHLVPSGICYANTRCIIGNGVVVNPAVLLEEMDLLRSQGMDIKNLSISDRAHIVMPYHILLDSLEEDARGGSAIGTTRRGIGPAYADKTARLGIRAADLLDKEAFRERLQAVLEQKNRLITVLYGASPLSLEQVYQEYVQYGERLAPFICETDTIIDEALVRGEPVLLEGAQGTLLDVDYGTYPYVTSTTTMVGGACAGLGIPPSRIHGVLGVFKAYSTRVGGGPMPTELKDKTGELIRERAHEYGTTTGRARRCGWFDAVVGRMSTRLNGFTGIALTRLDILDTLPQVKVCTDYEVEGKLLSRPPANGALWEKCRPVYEELPGWQSPINHLRRFKQLPSAAQAYVRRLEELLACPIAILSVGPSREETIVLKSVL